MNKEGIRKNSEAIIARLNDPNRAPAKSWDEAWGQMAAEDGAKQMLRLCDIHDALTEDEHRRLAAVPAYQNDLREVADIRAKYGISWNDLRKLRDME